MLHLVTHRDFARWRDLARSLLAADVAPDQVLWSDDEEANSLLATDQPLPPPVPQKPTAVPRTFLDLANYVACFRDPDRWNLLYRVLYRLARGGERNLLDRYTDDDVVRLNAMDRAVHRDRHKMTAFVRFRLVTDDTFADRRSEQYVAWHRPDHYIVRLTAPFFRGRFATLNWTILTPDDSVAWDGTDLSFGPGVPQSAAPAADELEGLWRTYYANIFNPARVKVRAMKKELPVRHWPTLPETQLVAELLADAPRRVQEMIRKAKDAARPGSPKPGSRSRGTKSPDDAHPTKNAHAAGVGSSEGEAHPASPAKNAHVDTRGDAFESLFSGAAPKSASHDEPISRAPSAARKKGQHGAEPFVPSTRELPVLRDASKACEGCDLCHVGTQTVFGEGPADAVCMFVGEQPGDHEDRQGRPFVGPAGQLLSEVLLEVGIVRDECYVTNAVKHFKWEPRGTRRIHAKPSAREVSACRPWLEAEIAAVKPRMLVCLGSTAAQSLLGREFRVTTQRGQPAESEWAPWTMATIHPSALLRIPDPAMRAEAQKQFVADLKLVAEQLKKETRKGL